MSPLWRDRITVELSPQRVAWVRMARSLRPFVMAKGIVIVPPQTELPAWRSALDQFKQLMTTEEWKNSELTIVLSNYFVRYDCLPWNEGVKNEDEHLALALHRLTQIYGAVAQNWSLRLSPAGKDAARMVAAVDHDLIESIKLATAEAKLKLRSIQPCLMTSFNRYAKEMGLGTAWFVTVEAGRFALALFRGGKLKHIQLRSGEGVEELHDWLERENLTSGEEPSCREVYLFAPELHKEAALPGYQLHRLELPASPGYSPITDVQYTIAMSGTA